MADSSVVIAVETQPEAAAQIRQAVAAGLLAFNSAHSQPYEVLPITIAALDVEGAIVGGLAGEIRGRLEMALHSAAVDLAGHRQHGMRKDL